MRLRAWQKIPLLEKWVERRGERLSFANFFDGHQLDEDRALRKLFPQLIRTLKNTTVFENHRKSLIQHCERSELSLHYKKSKHLSKTPKTFQFGEVL